MANQQSQRGPARDTAPWWVGETGIRMSEVPGHVPAHPGGRRVSVATVYRWTTNGLNGIRLRRYRVGSAWCTTVEELVRWQAALTIYETGSLD